MVGSEESFEYISEPPISDEIKSIPLSLHCFTENITLSTIWIPSTLLPNRNEPQNTQVTRGIFHTLERRDLSRQKESFSVYVCSDDEETLEIFHSDEEDLLNLNIDNPNTTCSKNGSNKTLLEDNHAFSSNKFNIDETVPNKGLRKTESYISLHEILDDTPEFDVRALSSNFRKEDKFSDTQKKTSSNQKKNKQKKVKKNVGLDEFLSDYTPQDYQEACCQDYFNKIVGKPPGTDTDDVRIKSAAEFPELAPNEIKFVHSEKSSTVNSLSGLTSLIKTFNAAEQTNDVTCNKSEASEEISSSCVESVNNYRKLVIENIPGQTSKDDVQYLLCAYGEIISFSLERVGEFLKAIVEINLESCDIEWIIECLNESEGFGASTCKLKCYEQI